jgi:alpha-galactosidase
VLDDGWFGRRNSDTTSLGDWHVSRQKIPEGLYALSKRITSLGMMFGLWLEPEMISVDSDLYRRHPDWALQIEGLRPSFGRDQLVLDLSRNDVCEYIINMVTGLLDGAEISYIKWDMNRHMTEVGNMQLPPERQPEISHRYILGLYRILDVLTKAFPNVLFENCSGGGGRFDAGMLYYMPQSWTSDNTDAICRLNIQYGASMVFPAITVGAHISIVPNHQTGRVTSLAVRAAVAMAGNLGLELDLTKLSENETSDLASAIKRYKRIREVVQRGNQYRLCSPDDENGAAWCYVSQDKNQVVLLVSNLSRRLGGGTWWIKLYGLDADRGYKDIDTNIIYGGDELMNVGMPIPPKFDGDDVHCHVFIAN